MKRKYELVEIEKLVPYARNARKHSKEQIKKIQASIREFGFINPVLIDGKFGIIAGHGRVEAARLEGMDKVPCLFIEDLSETQKKAYILADNKLPEYATWDEEMLAIELEELQNLDFNIELTGFNIADFKDLFPEAEVVEDDFEVELPEEPKAKYGDIYQLGNHRLMCGDSTKAEDVERLMGGVLVDMVLTDPPYNVDYGSKAEAINKYGYNFSDRHIKNDYMPEFQFVDFLDKAIMNMCKNLKQGGVFYIWHASTTVHEFETALRLNSLKARQQLIWNKNSIVLSRQDYHWKHEPCLYGWKDGASHYFIDDRTLQTVIEDGIPKYRQMKKEELVKLLDEIYSDKQSTTIINEDKPAVSEEHPTMKPIKLLARLIKNSSKQEEVVQDLFGGSGSTLIACEQLGRKCYMMELDPKYIDVIIKRWEIFTGEEAVKL